MQFQIISAQHIGNYDCLYGALQVDPQSVVHFHNGIVNIMLWSTKSTIAPCYGEKKTSLQTAADGVTP